MRSLVLAATLAFAGTHLLPAATLTGVTLFSANSNGGPALPVQVWNTLGGDLIFNLYLLDGATALNSGNGSSTRINIPLDVAGTYTFAYQAQTALPVTRFGMNLFFDGDDSIPGISAFVSANNNNFQVSNAFLTPELDGFPVPASGSLTFISGDSTITLTALSQSPAAGNVVSAYDNTPGILRANDIGGSFTLTVATPEPGTYASLTAGLVALALLRRRK